MPPQQKKFVKYQFDDPGPKPREQRRQSRQNFKQRDSNTQTRNKRHVSYTEKSSSARQNVLRDMISSFIPIKKASPKITQLMKTFPKFFSQIPRQPQPFTPQSLNGHLAFMGKKILQRQARQFAPIQQESQSDPNWDSDSDVDGGIQSKKIDQSVVEKVKQKLTNVRHLRQDELKRHEKQFLQDYYRQKKHQQELQNNQKNENKDDQNPNSTNSLPNSQLTPDNQWTEYQQNQVNQFVNMGFIQKIQQDENDFSADDFSVQDQKSQDQKSEKSNSSDGDDDDIFGDEGPTRIVKVKAEADQPLQQKMGKVVINNHLFSRIAQSVGIPPGACIWIIRNKTQRYKVSTQFMDEMYRLNNFCQSLPYVSLNHSQFVHNNDVEKEKGLEIFKKFNARKHQTTHSQGNSHHKISNRTYQNKRKFQQYKPNPQQPNSKTHINKK